MSLLIEGGTLYTPCEELTDSSVLLEGSKIVSVGDQGSTPGEDNIETINVSGHRIIPGLIDLHLHGVRGFDVSGPDLVHVIKALPQFGVTAFLPTTYAGPRAAIREILRGMVPIIADPPPGTYPLGIHMEGPWLSPKQPGMANPRHFYPLSQGDIASYQEIAENMIRMATFAPEEGGALDTIPWLIDHHIIPSAGHTDADYQTIHRAVRLGLNHATHTCNAMRGLHHRDPGALGGVLDHDEITCQLIADGYHVHPAVVRLLLRAKGTDRVCLVSDATPPAGSEPGKYHWLGYDLFHDGETSRLADGTLAGSVHLLNQMLQVLVEQVGIPFPDALQMATQVPARLLGVKKGELRPGYDADVVVLDDDYQVVLTIVGGKIIYAKLP